MKIIKMNCDRFEYDVHSLLKAFCGEERVKVLTPSSKKDPDLKEEDIFAYLNFNNDNILLKIGCNTENNNGVKEFCSNDLSLITDKNLIKDKLKSFLYLSFVEIFEKEVTWGKLTGIRQKKIETNMIELGAEESELGKVFKGKHFVSEQKTKLAIEISRREREILSTIHYKEGYSLYIGIPFCPTTCLYCSFTSYPISVYRNQVEQYIMCLVKEMKHTATLMKGKILDTVYIGGGTTTNLEAHQLDFLITKLKETFDFTTVKEFTV